MSKLEVSKLPEVITYLVKQDILDEIHVITAIDTGASGAKLFDIVQKDNRFIVKQSNSLVEMNEHTMDGFKKEFLFYSYSNTFEINVPEVIYAEHSPLFGYIIVLKYYKPISELNWNSSLQSKVIDLIVQLHCIDLNIIEDKLSIHYNQTYYLHEDAEQALNSWNKLLNKHDLNAASSVSQLFESLNLICKVMNSGDNCVCHGDFHLNNVMYDEKDEKLLLIDWQAVTIGKGASDLSFFMSRGKDYGLNIDELEFVSLYCERLEHFKGIQVDKSTILKHIHASNVFVSFMYWPNYLADASSERVTRIFNDMINSYTYVIT